MTSTLTVMTWNVENLFPAGHKHGPPDRKTYDVKIAYLATTIRGLNPDVVALQEVGDPQCAQDLASAVGGGWQIHLADPPAGNHPIRVGVLSPHPVTVEDQVVKLPDAGLPAVPDVDGKPLTRMGRGALQVHVDVGGGLQLLTCHLKSKLLTYRNRRYPKNEDERARGAGYALLRRAAEAVAVRVQLNKIMTASATGGEPGVPTILCGDLNDGPDAVTTTLLAGPSDGDINRPDLGDPVRLYNQPPPVLRQ